MDFFSCCVYWDSKELTGNITAGGKVSYNIFLFNSAVRVWMIFTKVCGLITMILLVITFKKPVRCRKDALSVTRTHKKDPDCSTGESNPGPACYEATRYHSKAFIVS